jgi:phospholipid/cholesterol/gamma-HCH transport system ATP-binding protein
MSSARDDVMISVDGVVIGFGDTVLLRDIDFDVAAGSIFAILGGSGCGKSTLLRHLIGLDRPAAGAIRIAGIGAPDLDQGAPRYGVLFQSGALFGSMTLIENTALPLTKWTDLDVDAIEMIALARLRLVGLAGFENHLPAEISGGMKKRAGIARALALDPPLLFLDEPSAGLDPVTAAELDDLLLTLNANLGMTIVIVTHDLDSIFKVAARCIVLDREAKGIIARGDPRELRDGTDDPRVRRFFHRAARTA